VVLAAAVLLAGASTAGATPNIVVLVLDDAPALDGRLLSAEPTALSTFVQHGVTFADLHSESPLCCPARAGFLTGQHTHNHGVTVNLARLFDPRVTVATQLAGRGYYTALVGKYFNRYGDIVTPGVTGPPPGWDWFEAFAEPAYYDYTLLRGRAGEPLLAEEHGSAPDDYSTDVLAQGAVDAIRSVPPGMPLFLWVAVYAPHAGVLPAPRYEHLAVSLPVWKPPNYDEADVSDKPAYVQGTRAAKPKGFDLRRMARTLRAADDALARIQAELAAQGRLADTLLVLTGDNGMSMGEHRLQGKQAPYVTQIPFYASWPLVLGTAPRTVWERLQNIDVAPTLCALSGCTLGPYPNGQARPDGLSFAALLLGTRSHLSRDAVLDEMPETPGRASLAPPWFAVTTTAQSPLAREGCAAAASGGCRWHYVEYDTGERELYDVSNGPCWSWSDGAGDPCELQNVAGQPPYAGLARQLHDRLSALRTERGAG
jgi:N-acetylglucosamine-6-sulfatase